MAKVDALNTIESLANTSSAKAALNENFQHIADAFENTLSRDGSTPNQMEADIDLNSNDLLNVAVIDASTYLLNGVPLEQTVAYSNKRYQTFSGNGSQTNFDLVVDPGSLGNLAVSVDGVVQRPGLDFNYAGTTLIFGVAPVSGTDNILVRFDEAVPLGTASAEGITYQNPSTLTTTTVQEFLDELWEPTQTKGAGLIRYMAPGTGAIPTTVENVLREQVMAITFGVLADGVTNCSALLQNAINEASTTERELVLPAGDIVAYGLSIPPGGRLYMRGSEAGTQGTRLLSKADVPIMVVEAGRQASIENVGFIGELDGGKPNQAGLYLIDAQNVNVRNCVFDNCYDSIKLQDTVFFCQVTDSRFFSVVRNQVRGSGSSGPGYALRFSGCQITSPSAGADVLYFENAGSLVFSDMTISPATASGRCLRLVSNASLSGIHQFDNCVFEGSQLEALRIEGTGPNPIKYCYFSNCYFNQAGAGADAITLVNASNISFVNSYISGTGGSVLIDGPASHIRFVNTDHPGFNTPAVFRSSATGAVNHLDIINSNHNGATRFVDFSTRSSLAAVKVRGGYLGSHASPFLVNAADVAQYSVDSTGFNQTRNGGTATFNGGVSTFTIAHGLLGAPRLFNVLSNTLDAGNAEIREVTADASNLYVQCKAAAAAGVNNVKWVWTAEL